jgi:hypothetical protein
MDAIWGDNGLFQPFEIIIKSFAEVERRDLGLKNAVNLVQLIITEVGILKAL